ncbi:MAG: FAD-dependent oxidoreductase [Planctomycetaceae bacterium]|nr:MAG: FAD-dependent oxidoreductase [Planctomycetaceae bacterium]
MTGYRFSLLLTVVLLCLSLSSLTAGGEQPASARGRAAQDRQVLVYGATPGGISAAVTAAKGDHTVLLVEPTDRIGGLMTSGLSYTDFRSFESLTGFYFDFSQRVQAHYEQQYGNDSEQAKAAFRGTHGEPSVNLLVMEAMLAEYPKITVLKDHEIVSAESGEFVRGRRRIVSARFQVADETVTLKASVFIDASYEGDLMALAGEPYHVGRESKDQYGEPMAGDAEGKADGQVQGYNLRLIMTTDKPNMRAMSKPERYNRDDFVGVLPVFTSGNLKKVFAADRSGIFRAHMPLMPNNKTDMNDTPHAPVRLSMPDINDGYPDGDGETRRRIVQQHYDYNLGLLYFLQNDDAVPQAIREDARRWGLCRDEFQQTEGISPKLYIREARRLVGQHVFTGRDTRQAVGDARSILHKDSIAIGDYVHNCHGTGRIGTRYDGKHDGEFYEPVPPYQIPYGVIVPTKSDNLLVPVACSASHFGFGALRLEPIWCSLGQAAGWAASLSLQDDVAVQNVDVGRIQHRLHGDRGATIYVSDVPPTSGDFAAVQWFGTRGGLHGLAPSGQPEATRIIGQYNEAFPGHAAQTQKPLDEATYRKWQTLAGGIADNQPLPKLSRREFIMNAWQESVAATGDQR